MKSGLKLVPRPAAETKPTGRLRKLECLSCGYIIRTTDKWINAKAPACACGGDLRLEDGTVLAAPLRAVAVPLEAPAVAAGPDRSSRPRAVGQLNAILAAGAAGFTPVASYAVAHIEARQAPYLWGLVVACLVYSAPTMTAWARQHWCKTALRAWGFTIVLETTMIASQLLWLNLVGLGFLLSINAAYAWERAKGAA